MKLERQPSNLIDSFAQTETHSDTVMTVVDNATPSNDMVDSGVGSQHKSTGKETATMDEDEDISLSCEATGDNMPQPIIERDDDDEDKKDDEAS